MKVWAAQDAKARFSAMLDACVHNGPQLVTRRGVDAAVLVPVEQWQRMQSKPVPTLKELLLADGWRGDMVMPERGKARRRPATAL
jgi:prevent-host-death family protein